MRKELFDDLIESVNEAVAIKRGLVAPARVTTFEMPDVKAIRTKAKLKQNEFAQVVGVSPSLVQAWEQQKSLKLLRVIEKHPDMLNLFRTA